jgi:hypothetical protein
MVLLEGYANVQNRGHITTLPDKNVKLAIPVVTLKEERSRSSHGKILFLKLVILHAGDPDLRIYS